MFQLHQKLNKFFKISHNRPALIVVLKLIFIEIKILIMP